MMTRTKESNYDIEHLSLCGKEIPGIFVVHNWHVTLNWSKISEMKWLCILVADYAVIYKPYSHFFLSLLISPSLKCVSSPESQSCVLPLVIVYHWNLFITQDLKDSSYYLLAGSTHCLELHHSVVSSVYLSTLSWPNRSLNYNPEGSQLTPGLGSKSIYKTKMYHQYYPWKSNNFKNSINSSLLFLILALEPITLKCLVFIKKETLSL